MIAAILDFLVPRRRRNKAALAAIRAAQLQQRAEYEAAQRRIALTSNSAPPSASVRGKPTASNQPPIIRHDAAPPRRHGAWPAR